MGTTSIASSGANFALGDSESTTDLVSSVTAQLAAAPPISTASPSSSKPICVGGGETSASAFSTNAQDYVQGFGFNWNPNDPFASVYPLILSVYRPPGHLSGGSWDALAEACMRTRTMLFCNKVPYDCLSGPVAAGTGNEKLISAASGIGVSVASVFVPLPGVGQLINGIIGTFAAHAQAEAKQSNTLCAACGSASEGIQSFDNAVASNAADAGSAYQGMNQLSLQFAGFLAQIYKKGNAADGYERIMKCQLLLSSYGYGLTPLPVSIESPSLTIRGATSGEQLGIAPSPINNSPFGPSTSINSNEVTAAPSAATLLSSLPIFSSVSSTTLLIIAVIVAILWGFVSGAL